MRKRVQEILGSFLLALIVAIGAVCALTPPSNASTDGLDDGIIDGHIIYTYPYGYVGGPTDYMEVQIPYYLVTTDYGIEKLVLFDENYPVPKSNVDGAPAVEGYYAGNSWPNRPSITERNVGYVMGTTPDGGHSYNGITWSKGVESIRIYYGAYSITYLSGTVGTASNMPSDVSWANVGYQQRVSSTRPTASGYVFTGWSVTPSVVPTTPGQSYTMPNQDVVFTAQWARDVNNNDIPDEDETFSITYKVGMVGSASNMPTNMTEALAGTSQTVPTNVPVASGYVFTGWGVTPSVVPTTPGQSYTMPNQDVVFTAQWAPDVNGNGVDDSAETKYSIIYDNGGIMGAFMPSAVSSLLPDTTQTVTTIIPTATNHVFSHWTVDPALDFDSSSIPVTAGGRFQMPNQDVVFTAHWEDDRNNNDIPDGEEHFSITYLMGTVTEATGMPANVVSVVAGSSQVVASERPVSTGWIFDGWAVSPSTDYDGTAMPTTGGASYAMPLANVTFTAQWAADTNNDGVRDDQQVIIAFEINGNANGFNTFTHGSQSWAAGTTTPILTLQTPGETLTYPQGVERIGDNIALVGWTPDITASTVVPDRDTTYILTYGPDLNNDGNPDIGETKYSVTYDAGIAEGVASLAGMPTDETDLVAGQPMVVTSDRPTADGYQFTGWSVELSTLPTTAGERYDMPAEDVIFTAQWDVQITFFSSAGFVGESDPNLYDGGYQTPGDTLDNIPTPVDSNDDGVVFHGWSPAINPGGTLVPNEPTTYGAVYVRDDNNDGVADGSQVRITFTIAGNPSGFQTFRHGSQSWNEGETQIETLQTPGDTLAYPQGVERTGDNIASEGWTPVLSTDVPKVDTAYILTYSADENNDNTPDRGETKYDIAYSDGSVTGVAGMPTDETGLLAGSSQRVSTTKPTAPGWIFTGWSVMPAEDYANNPMPTDGGGSFLMPRSDVTFTAQWTEDSNGDGVADDQQVEITFTVTGNASGFQAFSHGSQNWSEGEVSIETLQTPGELLVYPSGVEDANDNIALVGWNPDITVSSVVPKDPTTYNLEYGVDENNDGTPDMEEGRYDITYSGGSVTGVAGMPTDETGLLAGSSQRVSTTKPTAPGWIFTGWSVMPAEDYANNPMPTDGGGSFLMPRSDVTFTAQWTEDSNGDGVADDQQVEITFTVTGNASGFQAFSHGSQNWSEGEVSIETLQTPGELLVYPSGVEDANDNIALVGWNPDITVSSVVPKDPTTYNLEYGVDENNDGTPDMKEIKYTVTYSAGVTVSGATGLPAPVTDVLAGISQTVASEEPRATGWIFTGWSVIPSDDYVGTAIPTIAGSSFLMPRSDVMFTAQWTEDSNEDGVADDQQVKIIFTVTGNPAGFQAFRQGSQSWDEGETHIETLQTPGEMLAYPRGMESAGDDIALSGWNPNLPGTVPASGASYELIYEDDLNNDSIPDAQEQKYMVIYATGNVTDTVTGMPCNGTDVLPGSAQTVSAIVPKADGYVFRGWNVYPTQDYEGNPIPTSAGEGFLMPRSNVTFTATWAEDANGDGVPDEEQVEIIFTITGNSAGFASFSHGSQNWSAGQTTIVTLQKTGGPLVYPTGVERAGDGVALMGWDPVLPSIVPSSATTYKLIYGPDENNDGTPDTEETKYTITYDPGMVGTNASNMPSSITDVLAGTTQQVSNQQPTATGYRFAGWNVEPNILPTNSGASYTMPAQNVTFTAQWDVQITFTSAYGFAGSSGYTYDGGYQAPGRLLSNVPTPLDNSTDNVVFIAWQPAIDVGTVVPTGPTVYIAQYAADENNDGIPDKNQVTITFYSERGFTTAGGATKEIVTVQEPNGVLNIPDTPLDTSVDKVAFVGWNTDPNAEVGSMPIRVPTEDMTYYAIYQPDMDGDGIPDGEEERFSITYDPGIVGTLATGMPSGVADVPAGNGQTVSNQKPTATGWIFDGWSVEPIRDYEGNPIPISGSSIFRMPEANVTFTALWVEDANGDGVSDEEQVEITFTITGNLNGFEAFTNGAQSWPAGKETLVTIQEAGEIMAAPTGVESANDNIALIGWSPALPRTVPESAAIYTLSYGPDEDNDNRPDLEESKYAVTYDAGAAAGASDLSGMPTDQTGLVEGQTVTVGGSTPTASGYQFIGWSVNVSGLPITDGAKFTMPEEDVVFTAQWKVGITFESGRGFEEGNSPYGPIYQTSGELLTSIPTPVDTDRDNVVFTGWQPSIEEGITAVPNEATTYVAQYEADANNDGRPDGEETTYSITYAPGIAGASVIGLPTDVTDLLPGSSQTMTGITPSATGYIFRGWTVFPQTDYDRKPISTVAGSSFGMPERDVIFTARWSEDSDEDGIRDDQQVEITFTITGNSAGFQAFALSGSSDGATTIVTRQEIGRPLQAPAGRESANDGIALVGWDPALPSTVPESAATYELFYGTDGNNNDTPDDQEVMYHISYEAGVAANAKGIPDSVTGLLAGSNQQVASTVPTADGWIFNGWRVNVIGLATTPGASFTMPARNVVFTAQWSEDSNGDGVRDDQQVEIAFVSSVGLIDEMGAHVSGSIVTLQTPRDPLQAPEIWESVGDGVTIHDWSTDPNDGMGSDLTGELVPNTDTTYYAIVTHDPQATQKTRSGTATMASTDGYRPGQDYSADISDWFTDADTTNLTYGVSSISGSGNATLTGDTIVYTPDASDVGRVVTLEVTAEDGSATASVVVEITVIQEADRSGSKQIIDFVIYGQIGRSDIDHVAGDIKVVMPIGTDLSCLEPIVTHSGAKLTPSTGIVQDFTKPVIYTVRAEDDTTKTYTVTVHIMSYVNGLREIIPPPSSISLTQAYDRVSIVENKALPCTTLAQMGDGSTFNIQLVWRLKSGEIFTNAPGASNTYVWTAIVPDYMEFVGVTLTGETKVINAYTSTRITSTNDVAHPALGPSWRRWLCRRCEA